MTTQVRLAWGKTRQGRLAHVTDVPAGKDCHCVCPACGQPLIAKRGQVIRPHFAHAVTSECSQAPSLARIVLNLLAHRALHEVEVLPILHLPEQAYEVPSLYGVGAVERRVARESQVFTPERVLEPEEVGLAEFPLDLILEGAGGHRLGLVLHSKLSPEEVEQLKHAGIPTLCYDLEQLAALDVTAEQVREILGSHQRSRDGYWLYSRIAEDTLAKALVELDERRKALRAQEATARRRHDEAERVYRKQAAAQARRASPGTASPHETPSEPVRTAEQNRLAERERCRRQVLALVDAHIERWSRDSLATLPTEEALASALSEAKQGARARLQARIPAADEVWRQTVLTPRVKELAQEGADVALTIWRRRRSR